MRKTRTTVSSCVLYERDSFHHLAEAANERGACGTRADSLACLGAYPKLDGVSADAVDIFSCLCADGHGATETPEKLEAILKGCWGSGAFIEEERYRLRCEWEVRGAHKGN